jgi:hypothetical protein
MEAEIKAGLKEVEVMDMEKNPEGKEVVEEHQKVPTKEAAVEIIGALEDRRGY